MKDDSKQWTLVLILWCTTAVFSPTFAGSFKTYSVPEGGFKVALPSEPIPRILPETVETITVYQPAEKDNGVFRYSVFVGRPKQGIFESESMDAWLDSKVKTAIKQFTNAKLLAREEVTFQERRGVKFSYEHEMAGLRYIGRTIIFMVDGGDMKVSLQHPANASDGESRFNELVNSFSLVPLAYVPAPNPVTGRGISFIPPKDWSQEGMESPFDVGRFRNLTRFMGVIAANQAGYLCQSYRDELKGAAPIHSSAVLDIDGRKFMRLMVKEFVPKYKVTLSKVHYCLDSANGAVILIGVVEDTEEERWDQVLRGAAATIRSIK